MQLRVLSLLLLLLLTINFFLLPSSAYQSIVQQNASEILEQEPINPEALAVPTVNSFLLNLQKYSGVNFLIDFLAEGVIKSYIKLKTKSKKVKVDLKIYDAWDLFRKKAKSLKIQAESLTVKDLPIKYFELTTESPIYFKKEKVGKKKKNRAVIPLEIISQIKIDLNKIDEVLNGLPKWKKVLGELELPLPPFGSTRVALKNLDIKIDDQGFIQASSLVSSVINPEAEPLELKFVGKLVVKDKKLIVSDLQCEVKDIFTKESDIGNSFSKFLEDLINPVFNFHKYEKKSLRIDSVRSSFQGSNLILDINMRIVPHEIK